MRILRNIALSTGILLLGFSLARAQEKDPVGDTPPAGQTDAKQQFDRVFSDWKEKLKQLREVQVKFQKADTGEEKTLRKEFQTLVDEAKVLVPQLTSAAEKAYLAAPNQDKDVLDFMSSVLADHSNKDNYEDAYRVSKLLVDNKADSKKLYSMGGVAAFMTHHYDEAEELLETARKNGELAALPQGSPEFLNRLKQLAEQSAGGIEKYRKLWAKEKEIRAAEAKADDLPRVKLETSQGDIVIELYENEAPIATANFISLVEKGFYNGLKFHRVLPGFMAQGGCPQGTGTGGPGYNIPCECYNENYRTHFRGSLSMAHAGRDTGGSQFFLTFVHTPHLDAKHTVFGRVIEGMGVTAKFRRVEPNKGGQPDTITKATVIRKRDHEYEPKKLPAR